MEEMQVGAKDMDQGNKVVVEVAAIHPVTDVDEEASKEATPKDRIFRRSPNGGRV
jgi:hypothetical protein